MQLLRAFTERLYPGRWVEAREPNEQELKATLVVSLAITEAVAKVRTGGPIEDVEDLERPVWAGVVPLRLVAGTPVVDAGVPSDSGMPALAWPPG